MTKMREKTRQNDPHRTQENILDVATEEFAENGLAGGRVDQIAALTKTSKRMIYYYFGSKEGLYLAVLERAYRKIRSLEEDLQLTHLPPEEAMGTLVSSTFDHDEANPVFVRLVSIENIHHAAHLNKSDIIRDLNISVLEVIDEILARGLRSGVFKRKVEPLDLHLLISSFCFFRVSNRHTFGSIFRCDLSSSELIDRHKSMITDAVLGYLRTV
ncbi:TetR/AcrR family transcriptional regulator [Agrobacterium tumefaciens]|uniref:TetR/AcrR family transcriptional regulator n=1 Tax=Agrobacterium tumefaciens TaxID=358 RepID=UPI001571F118|nr:TetR/AcrR family transcriptional regulator [Agrobacterium tumefaciens]